MFSVNSLEQYHDARRRIDRMLSLLSYDGVLSTEDQAELKMLEDACDAYEEVLGYIPLGDHELIEARREAMGSAGVFGWPILLGGISLVLILKMACAVLS